MSVEKLRLSVEKLRCENITKIEPVVEEKHAQKDSHPHYCCYIIITIQREKKQITTIDLKLLQSPISKTDGNLLIDDYLIERISRAKKGSQPKKILFKTLYEKVGTPIRNNVNEQKDKIVLYLDHYKACGLIAGYSVDPESVTVIFDK